MGSTVRCRLIAGLILADDNVRFEERLFLERAVSRLGLSDEERKEALSELDTEGAAAAAAGLPEAERRAIMSDLATAAAIDGDLHEAEERYLRKVATSLGLEWEYVAESQDLPDPEALREKADALEAVVRAYTEKGRKT